VEGSSVQNLNVDLVEIGGFHCFVEKGDLLHSYVPGTSRFLESPEYQHRYFTGAPAATGGGFGIEPAAELCVKHVARVGCQYGVSTMQIAQAAGQDSQVHALDPGIASDLAPINFENNGFPGIRFHKVAAAARSGWGLIMGERGNTENNRAGFVAKPDFSYPARFARLDDIDFGDPDMLFAKIDTQGFEPEVFEGAQQLFTRPCAIVAEFTPWAILQRRQPDAWLAGLQERFAVYKLDEVCIPVTDAKSFTQTIDTSRARWCDLVLLSKNLPEARQLGERLTSKAGAR
jgi:FkbM family methyltransferase